MKWEAIQKKAPGEWGIRPNLVDYENERANFSWGQARKGLSGLPGGRGLNIAHECIDRYVAEGLGDRLAVRFLGKGSNPRDFSFGDLSSWTNRFANVLSEMGVGKGDGVFSLLGRVPELFFVALGTLKNRSVYSPLFSAFGPEPIQARLSLGDAKVLVTTESLYRKKIAGIRPFLPKLEHVLIFGEKGGATHVPGTRDLYALLEQADPRFSIGPTQPEDPALLHFTSGTTGRPKGAIHVHEAILEHSYTGKIALDFHPDDIFWCTADPGWVTGTSYGILSPLANGVTSIVDEAEFDAGRWYQILQDQKVTVWYTAPTAVRMLMKAGADLPGEYDLSRLRFIASVGEPLNPEAVVWGLEVLGLPIHDNWWQTETGGIMISNFASQEIRPGSMGKALPGIEAFVARRTSTGGIERIEDPEKEGELVLKAGWPSMFRGYLHEEERYRNCFAGGYYFTGDLAKKDRDGFFWFLGRADDVIKSAGHLIGPFEVESTLMEHPAVAEAAVIGKPDPTIFETVKAFVSLKPGIQATEELRLELLGFGRKRLGAVVAPKEIDFLPDLPRTRSGKIMRRLLKAKELGLPIGDTSTLESAA